MREIERGGEKEVLGGSALDALLLSAVREGEPAPVRLARETKQLEGLLLAAAMPWGTPLQRVLARHRAAPRKFTDALRGAAVRVDARANTVWILNASRAFLQAETSAAAKLAHEHGTFALWFYGESLGPEATCVAWGHAPLRDRGREPVRVPAGARTLEEAMSFGWGTARAQEATTWREAEDDVLLPPMRKEFERYRVIIERVSKEEAAAGHAGSRAQESLDMRAAATLLAMDLRRQLGEAEGTALPGSLYKRLVAKATAQLLSPSVEPPKPQWYDLEGIVEKAGWERLTAANCGYPWPHVVQPPVAPGDPPGKLQFINPNALLLAFQQAMGGEVPHDHAVWTICAHAAGHTPQVAPHLEEAIAGALKAGHPLYLFDPARMEPLPAPREHQLWWQQVERLVAQGSFTELVGDEVLDPTRCLMVGEMGCVFKGTPPRNEAEEAAVQSGNVAQLSAAAAAHAAETVRLLEERVAKGGEGARYGHALEAMMAEECGVFSKIRPVARFQACSRGSEALGLAPGGIPPSGCQMPHLSAILWGATALHQILRMDCKDYFYTLPLSKRGSALCCLAVRDTTAKLRVFSLNGCCMGLSDSPAVAEVVSSLLCAIANARGAATPTNLGFHAQCDDLIYLGLPEERAQAETIMEGLLLEVAATEALDKRVSGSVGEVLGKTFNMPAREVPIAPARLLKYLYNMHLGRLGLAHDNRRVRKEITPAFLSRVTGTLGWLSENMISGAAHLSALYSVTAGSARVGKLRKAVLCDLEWWHEAAAAGRVQSTLWLDGHARLTVRTMEVDAADGALGACAVTEKGKRAAYRRLKRAELRAKLSSARRELRSIALGLEVLGEEISGSSLAIMSDSVAGALAFNKGRLRGKGGQADVQRIYELLEKHNIRAVAIYLPRELNRLADSLSKITSKRGAYAWAAERGIALTSYTRWLRGTR